MTSKAFVANWDCENMCAATQGRYNKENDALLLEANVLLYAQKFSDEDTSDKIDCHLKKILA